MKRAEFASCHLVNIKVAIDSLLLKQQLDEDVKEIATSIKVEKVLYL